MPSSRRNSTKKSNSSGRLHRLHHRGHGHVHHLGQPEGRPLPTAQVGQGQDRADARRPASARCGRSPRPRTRRRSEPATTWAAGTSRPSSGCRSGRSGGRPDAAARPVKPGPWTRCRLRSVSSRRSADTSAAMELARPGRPGRPPVGARLRTKAEPAAVDGGDRLDVERTELHARVREYDGCPGDAARPARSGGRCGWRGPPGGERGAWARPAVARRWPDATPSRSAARP